MTRIIAGKHRGRRLQVPTGNNVRPTTDRMRERLFSMLSHTRYPDIDGAIVADIFAGTGALGLEALSRGAEHVTFVENARASLDCLNTNIKTLGVSANADIRRDSAMQIGLTASPCNIIFMDPPYRQNLVEPTLNRLASNDWIADDNVIVCEIASDDPKPDVAGFEILDERTQGQQCMLFMRYTSP
ncbi:16S rRNA (guanine(966)-N(2))-methyltransferase RsmD [Kordiimonas aquimaris]|uniref:16S rRNA (guanine(966)-N(2))-methyltransferase RsmD n=1 Tax=Kordiimonas aquimaris TaxID=707591 RepID=UPI0021D0F799|nr:16S rRNA (guanine(966)-N(2))-methyltransferase RsmD [Kordiimonas aquimaris]